MSHGWTPIDSRLPKKALLLTGLFLLPALSAPAAALTRGPYLQVGTPTGLVVRWRTDLATDSRVRYGPAPGSLTSTADNPTVTTEHAVSLAGLSPETTYYYSVGSTSAVLAGDDANTFFRTSPPAGASRPTRIWVLGDSGTANSNAQAVRNAYLSFTGTAHTNFWLMLGDNAYPDGTDSQYQAAVFNMYPTMLRKSVLWSTLGNHDGHTADSATQTGPYYDIFTLPPNGEAGGLASGTEAYYSFDYGNVHLICLESYETSRSPTGAMMTWLAQDLEATAQPWIIAFWHHPPYTKGSHNSDTEIELVEMRQNALPVLEDHGVDLVLTGHSHSYERSFLIDGHYGTSGTLSSSMVLDGGDGRVDGTGAYLKPGVSAPHEGAVYVVAGSSGQISGGTLNHPAMFVSLNVLGSLVLDLNGLDLDAKFLDTGGAFRDYFTIRKGANPPEAPTGLTATAISSSQIALAWADNSATESSYRVERSPDGAVWSLLVQLPADSTAYTDGGLSPLTTYHYRVQARNAVGDSAWSNVASATTPEMEPVDQTATGEIPGSGTSTGTVANTRAADQVYQTLREEVTKGKPSSRTSLLEWKWTFDVVPGNAVTLFVKAYQNPSAEGEEFLFAYSTDNQSFTNLLTVNRTVDDGTYQSALLPPSLSGTVYLRVRDSQRVAGQRILDALHVDHLFIRSE